MLKKVLAGLCLVLMFAVAGCTNEPAAPVNDPPVNQQDPADVNEPDNNAPEMLALSEWNGSWTTVVEYFQDADVQAGFAAIEAEHDMAEGALIAMFGDMFVTDMARMVIENDTITFYAAAADESAAAVITYRAVEAVDGGEEGTAYKFQAVEADSAYPCLFMYAPEVDPDGAWLSHFHFRYGADFASIENNEAWVPMMVLDGTTAEQVINGFAMVLGE